MKHIGIITAALIILCLAAAAMADAPAPLAVNNRAIGGGALNQYTPGVEGGIGLNNIGLLIKTWGRVTAVDTAQKCFYIDDGSGLADGSGNVGVRVSYANLAPGNTITPPALDSYVSVTCISGTVIIGDKIRPNLRPRRQADIIVVAAP